MGYKRLCESDLRFMGVIWDNEPLTSSQLVKVCESELGWKKSTTYTMLRKLCEKGYAQNVDSLVSSAISRGKVRAMESDVFVEQTFDGSLPGFLVAFLGGKKISVEEAEELKRLIDSHLD